MDARVVLITGASSGIGQACARYLAGQGYRVFGTSRRPEASAADFEMIPMDVTDDDSVRRGVEEVMRRASRLDVLVNNAGFGLAGSVEDTTPEEAREQMETNFFGTLRLCRAVLPIMRAQRSGTIVNIGSLAGLIALPFQGLYSASKFALEGLTEALRMEVRPFGIRVVLIEPGDTRTNFTARRRRTRASGGSPYAERMERALAVAEHDERHGVPPETVARLLGRILRLRHPRLRYRAGSLFQNMAASAKRFLPELLFEWAVRKYYRI
ncbi:MAG: SDR family oxidoreductase [Chloroflexia bacterium]